MRGGERCRNYGQVSRASCGELAEARAFCSTLGVRQLIYDFDVFTVNGFADNPPERCYFCKHALFSALQDVAASEDAFLAEGSNLDDLGDYRPGLRAIAELGVASPLRQAELTKADIRYLSQRWQLATWEKPSFACLASRFAYGEKITSKKLLMVEKAEAYLKESGFRQFRVRMHGEELARIEVLDEDIERLMAARKKIAAHLRTLGYRYIAVDLQGYRTGSMNEVL